MCRQTSPAPIWMRTCQSGRQISTVRHAAKSENSRHFGTNGEEWNNHGRTCTEVVPLLRFAHRPQIRALLGELLHQSQLASTSFGLLPVRKEAAE